MQTQFYPKQNSSSLITKIQVQVKSLLFLSLIVLFQSFNANATSLTALNSVIPCGSTTCSLTSIQPSSCSSSSYEWHTVSSYPSASTLVTNPSVVSAGTYYLYKVSIKCGKKTYCSTYYYANCTFATNCAPCKPTPSATCGTIACGSNCFNLSNLNPSSVNGVTYVWHTVSCNPTSSNAVSNSTCVTAGVYYLYAYKMYGSSKYYSAASCAVTISNPTNCAPCKPTPTATCGTIACGSTCFNLTNLNPTSVNGVTYVWHTVSSNPSLMNEVNTSTCALAGVYYLYAYKMYGSSKYYSAASCAVSISNPTNCPVSVVIPCGSTCTDLTSYNPVAKNCYTIEWHSGTTNPCASNWISSITCVGVGTYQAYYVKISCGTKQYTKVGGAIIVTIAICNNLPPVAKNDFDTLSSIFTLNSTVINNDTDPQASTLTVNTTPLVNPIEGNVTLNSNGTYTYNLTGSIIGTDSFKYEICNTFNLCTTAWVFIYVDGSQYRLANNNTSTTKANTTANIQNIEESMLVYPIPATNEININFNSASEQNITAEILSIDGKAIANKSFKATIGINPNTINVNQLENGIYLIKLVTANKTYLNKISINR